MRRTRSCGRHLDDEQMIRYAAIMTVDEPSGCTISLVGTRTPYVGDPPRTGPPAADAKHSPRHAGNAVPPAAPACSLTRQCRCDHGSESQRAAPPCPGTAALRPQRRCLLADLVLRGGLAILASCFSRAPAT